MSNTPYPPYLPNQAAAVVGGLHHTCLVVDLFTVEPLTPAQVVQLEDQMEIVLSKQKTIKRSEVVAPHRFNEPLRRALQLY